MPLNRAALLAEVATNFADNTSGLITPALLRTTFNDTLNNVWTLADANSLSGVITFSSPPIMSGLTGILTGNGGSAISALSVGQIPGTATNDSASSGNIGEFLTATGSNIGLTSAAAQTITSVTLSAGDWDVRGDIFFNAAGTTTIAAIAAATSTVNNVFGAAPAGGIHSLAASFTTGADMSLPVGAERYSVGGSTVVYLVAQATFGVSTMTATGKISARRMR